MWKEIANNSRKNEMTINFSIRTYYDWRKEPIEVIRCIERCRAAYIFNDPKVNFLYGAEFNNGKESKGICSEQRWNNLKQDLRSGKINIIYIIIFYIIFIKNTIVLNNFIKNGSGRT